MTRFWMVLCFLACADIAIAGQQYDSFGAQSPKIIQSNDTIVSEWDEVNGGKKVVCVSGCSGGGAGDASAANQVTQTNILTTIDADTGNIATSAALLDDAVATTGSAIPAKGLAASGTDGTNARILKTDTSGELQIDVLTMPTVTVTDGAGALNVIVDSSALPSGASTLAEQQTQTTSLQLIDDVVHASDAAVNKAALAGCQFDDTTPGTTTEDSVRPLRCSTRREIYNQIRDAAGNERGANVNASNELQVQLGTLTNQSCTNNVAGGGGGGSGSLGRGAKGIGLF